MQIAYSCSKCERPNWSEICSATTELDCAHCGRQVSVPPGSIENNDVKRCLVCPSTDLFVRKDFPQHLGVLIVTVGLLGSCIAWAYFRLYLTFIILFATALIDVILYVVVPNALMCYRCGAMYRGAAEIDQHGSFDLEVHERHRQQKIRLAEAQRANAAQTL
jgi:DNA-directed RNA polymerase subunit RPC12/RpoP